MSSGRVAGVVQEAAVLSMAVSSLEVVIEILGRLFFEHVVDLFTVRWKESL